MATMEPEAFVVGISGAFTTSASAFEYMFRSAAGLDAILQSVR